MKRTSDRIALMLPKKKFPDLNQPLVKKTCHSLFLAIFARIIQNKRLPFEKSPARFSKKLIARELEEGLRDEIGS